MRRTIFIFALLIALSLGGWYVWQNSVSFNQSAHHPFSQNEFRTLEIRFTAEEIMHQQRGLLLKKQGYSFLEPKLLFYPHLLMEVKYNREKSETGEGVLLWGLNDGEIVIDTASWEKTHGYEDCLIAKADKNDFKIIEAIYLSGSHLEKEKISKQENVDLELVDKWIDHCRAKKLIVAQGNRLRLHFQNPKLLTIPMTRLDQPLVAQPTKNAQKMHGLYSSTQIKSLAQTAFGNDFAIRKSEEVYLPVYAISVQNPDGSILTTYWNALNGKKFDPHL